LRTTRPITRNHADVDASSLSALLMDGTHYALVRPGRQIVDGLSTLKAKAFLDLSERKSGVGT
jgi:hypothetical protein